MSHIGMQPLPVYTAMDMTAQRVKPFGYTACVVVRPDPLRPGGAIGKRLEIASAQSLYAHAATFESGLCDSGVLAASVLLGNPTGGDLLSLGFRRALVIRVPVVGQHHVEFVLLAVSEFQRPEADNAAAVEIFRSWPIWRSSISKHVCPLSAREREALLAVSVGYTGSEASEEIGVSQRTFRLHVDTAKKKLHAANGADAAHRALLLCAF